MRVERLVTYDLGFKDVILQITNRSRIKIRIGYMKYRVPSDNILIYLFMLINLVRKYWDFFL